MRDVKTILKAIEAQLTSIQVKLGLIEGRLTGVESRFSGLEFKLNSLPTVWTMLGITFTTWAIGSGILIFALNFLRR